MSKQRYFFGQVDGDNYLIPLELRPKFDTLTVCDPSDEFASELIATGHLPEGSDIYDLCAVLEEFLGPYSINGIEEYSFEDPCAGIKLEHKGA